MEPAQVSTAGAHPPLPGRDLTFFTVQHLPILSQLLALWLPGDLQIWSVQGNFHGHLARAAL